MKTNENEVKYYPNFRSDKLRKVRLESQNKKKSILIYFCPLVRPKFLFSCLIDPCMCFIILYKLY